jgi:hypothetical protein
MRFLDSWQFSREAIGAMANRQTRQPYTPPELETLPIFIRIPSSGTRCPHCGLSRSSLDLLTRPQAENGYKPPVKSRLFRQTGTVSKVRLIDYQSLKAYLHSLPDGSLKEKEEVAP